MNFRLATLAFAVAAIFAAPPAFAACSDHDGQLISCVADAEGCYYEGDLTGLCQQCASVGLAECTDPANGAVGSTSCVVFENQCVGPTFVPPDEPFCGDGEQDAGEQCDDGNTESGDGCSFSCNVEAEGAPMLDQEQYENILLASWQLAAQLFADAIPAMLAVALAVAIVSFAIRKMYAAFKSDDTREL